MHLPMRFVSQMGRSSPSARGLAVSVMVFHYMPTVRTTCSGWALPGDPGTADRGRLSASGNVTYPAPKCRVESGRA